jgi:flagellar motor switch protein FliG
VGMLRAMGRAKGREILTTIEAEDAETATKIKDRLFLFEDLARLPARGLAEVLRGVDARKLATALKGAEEAVRDRFLGALSERAAQMIREEMEYLAGARVQEIEEAQKEVRDVALQLEAAGTLNLEETEGAPAA